MRTRRQMIDAPLDWLRFQVDSRPVDYQPLAHDRSSRAGRADATLTRWRAMEPVLAAEAPRTAIDIGANLGWFTFALAERGIRTVAVERSERHYRSILYLRQRLGTENVSVWVGGIDPGTVGLLPHADCTLLLSVWHHMVREHGLPATTELVRALWSHTGKVLFFETGESEISKKFGLPDMTPTPAEWIDSYLTSVCEGARVEQLGAHSVPDLFGVTSSRTLFAVRR